jgi:hypothetical protein
MAMASGSRPVRIGLAKDHDGMTRAGLIRGGVGAPSVAGGIYVMMSAAPSATVQTAATPMAGAAVRLGGTF